MSGSRMLLEVEGLTAGYGDATIVHDVSFAIEEGGSLALLGRNGVGKTTLLRAIFGMAERFSGSVRLAGELVPPGRPQHLAQRGASLVPDDRGVLPRLTVAENLRLARRLAPPDLALDPLAALPDLRRRLTQPAGTLSGGLQQQLAVARALATGARLVVVDELSQGLQPSIVEALAGELRRVRDEHGVALLIVDQSPALALGICDRAVAMQKGTIVAAFSPRELAGGSADLDRLLVVD